MRISPLHTTIHVLFLNLWVFDFIALKFLWNIMIILFKSLVGKREKKSS